MRTFDPGFLEMSPQSEEWRKEHEQLIARVTVATAFTRKYPGMYEQLQESFNLRRTIEACMLQLDSIGPRFFDTAAAIERSTAFEEGIEREMRQIEAMNKSINPPPPPPQPADSDLDDGPAPYTGQYL